MITKHFGKLERNVKLKKLECAILALHHRNISGQNFRNLKPNILRIKLSTILDKMYL